MRPLAIATDVFLLVVPVVSDAEGQVAASDSVKITTEQAVKVVVTEFGKHLRSVAVLAPKPNAVAAMEVAYSGYVAADLLAKCKKDPMHAPGKRTSSPSPERIDISSIVARGSTAYIVTGNVILLTAQERKDGGIFQANPVTMTVALRQGKWIITNYKETETHP